MSAQKFKNITVKQIELAKKLYGGDTLYMRLLKSYEKNWANGICQKHSSHDSVFFIVDEGALGFKVIKFYDNGIDFRVGSFNTSIAEAYNEALLVL